MPTIQLAKLIAPGTPTPIPMPSMIVRSPGASYGARLATEAEVAKGIARPCDCASCGAKDRGLCMYKAIADNAHIMKATGPTMLVPLRKGAFLSSDFRIATDAEVARGLSEPCDCGPCRGSTGAHGVCVFSTRMPSTALAKNNVDAEPGETDLDPEWRKLLFHQLRLFLEGQRRANVEEAAKALDVIRDTLHQHLLASRREEVMGYSGKVDVASVFADSPAAKADAVAKAAAATANAAKVAQLAKQAPRRVPFVWPTDIGKEAREEGADRLLKTSDELRITDLGEAVRHDQRRERILKAVDRELAHLSEEDRRNALRSSRELAFGVLEHAIQHDQRRHELIEKHRGPR